MAKKNKALEQHIEQSLVPKPSTAHITERRFYDDFDDIFRFYHDSTGKLELSAKQQEQLDRWKWIRAWILNFDYLSDRDIIIAIQKNYTISEKQAYVDLKNTKRFFASMDKVEKEFEKIMMIQRLKKQQHRLKNAYFDPKNEAVLVKNEELLAKITGMLEPDNLMPVPVVVEIQPVCDVTVLGIDPIPEDRLVKLLKAFGQKKEEKRRLEIEDVDYELILKDGKPTR